MSIIESLVTTAKAAIGLYQPPPAPHPGGELLTGAFPGGIGEPPPAGTRQALDSYTSTPWIRAFAGKIAASIAAVQWEMYESTSRSVMGGRRGTTVTRRLEHGSPHVRKKGVAQGIEAGDLKPILSHPALDVLEKGNAYMSGVAVRKVMALHMEHVGEAFMAKERQGKTGQVVALWPIVPFWVISTPTPSAQFHRISYRGFQRSIPDTEVVWMRDPAPGNPYARGSGLVKTLATEVETDEYIAGFLRQWFINNARPDFLVSGELGGGDEIERLRRDWLKRNQGWMRKSQPYFLDGQNIDVHEFDQDFRSQQVVQLRQHERDTIRQSFGIPPELTGDVSNSNRSTIVAARTIYATEVLEPRLELMRAELQKFLIDEWGEGLVLDYASPVPTDRDFKLTVMQAQPQDWDVDEWRAFAGDEAMPEGKGKGIIWVPGTITTKKVETLDEDPPEPPPPPVIMPGMGSGAVPGQPALPPGAKPPKAKPGQDAVDEVPANEEDVKRLANLTDKELVAFQDLLAKLEG